MIFKTVAEIVSWRLCIGCGACKALCPEKAISLVNIESDGIRPQIDYDRCKKCSTCCSVCPGINLTHDTVSDNTIDSLRHGWGPVLEVWEGWAMDAAIRFAGSSGGVVSSLALFCLKEKDVSQIIHNGMDPDNPLKNKTIKSTTYHEILNQCGSRYSPASVCEELDGAMLESLKSVVIGKPCDCAAVRKCQSIQFALKENISLVIGIFCAGTPSTLGLRHYLKSNTIDIPSISSIRYRGNGWPGNFSVYCNNSKTPCFSTTYSSSWGYLQKYRPYRCYLCPDGTSEFADISVGDPWYREIENDEVGTSLILVRTEKGRDILQKALQAGYITLKPVSSEIVMKSQINLYSKRSSLWARLAVAKAFFIPTPRFTGFFLFTLWMKIPCKEKLHSIAATLKRIILRNYCKPNPVYTRQQKF